MDSRHTQDDEGGSGTVREEEGDSAGEMERSHTQRTEPDTESEGTHSALITHQ